MNKDTSMISHNLLAAAEELELHSKWLKTLAAILENKPADISEENHKAVLELAIESVASQITLTGERVDAIGAEL